MAHNRNRRSRARGPRIPTLWSIDELAGVWTDVAAATITSLVLFSPSTALVRPTTIVRVVGNIAVAPQAADEAVINWMIYKQTAASIFLNPSALADVSDETIMMHQSVAFNPTDVHAPLQNTKVDVKAMRRMVPGEDLLILSIRSTVAYKHAVSLRVLLRESSGS